MSKRIVVPLLSLSFLIAGLGTHARVRAQQKVKDAVWKHGVDVYVRKLRVKLEAALPGWRFIHTHFGFGYRLTAECEQGGQTGSSQLNNTGRPSSAETLMHHK